MTTYIIGAGMAGISAARDLQAAGENTILLEARNRIGGRVWTDREFASFPVELGAEFLHGENVPTWEFVRKLGLHTIFWKRGEDALVRMWDGEQYTMPEARNRFPDFDVTRTWAIPKDQVPPEDESLEQYLRRIGFSEDQLQIVRRTFANASCEAMHLVSAKDALLHMDRSEYGHQDHRVVEGYSTIIHHLAEGLDIRLNTAVTEIDWSYGDSVVIKTTNGETFYAEQIIIAVPVAVLQSGNIRFIPELPAKKLFALSKISMAPALKLVYRFDEPVLPRNTSGIYSPHNPPMWWSPSFERDAQEQVWTAFATGDWARELLVDGDANALQLGLETFRRELGHPDITPNAMKIVNWRDDPFAQGGYSASLVGGIDGRAELAQPVDNKLFWAGEATAFTVLSATVHGAYLTGKRAAQEVLTKKQDAT